MFGSVTRFVFRGREAVAAQAVSASAARVPKGTPSKVVSSALKRVDQQILVCGNLLSWGFHGVAFAAGVDRRDLWAAVADALYRIRCADRLFGNTDLVIVKDVTEPHAHDAEALKRFSYRPLETEPNMVLDIAPSWRAYDDYLAGLTANYRKAARVIARDFAAAGYVVERLSDVDGHARTLHDLYLQVHERQKYRMVTLAPEFVRALANAFPADCRVTVARRDSDVVGFVTTLRDGDTAVGYYIGFDSMVNAETPLYLRLLHGVVQDAIEMGVAECRWAGRPWSPRRGWGLVRRRCASGCAIASKRSMWSFAVCCARFRTTKRRTETPSSKPFDRDGSRKQLLAAEREAGIAIFWDCSLAFPSELGELFVLHRNHRTATAVS
jgi:Acetyltransferase (GNAT) domain